jgi:hypothetical protein
MWTEGLLALVGQAIFLEGNMASGAAVSDVLFGNPDLLNAALKVFLEPRGVRALLNQFPVLALVVTPLAE